MQVHNFFFKIFFLVCKNLNIKILFRSKKNLNLYENYVLHINPRLQRRDSMFTYIYTAWKLKIIYERFITLLCSSEDDLEFVLLRRSVWNLLEFGLVKCWRRIIASVIICLNSKKPLMDADSCLIICMCLNRLLLLKVYILGQSLTCIYRQFYQALVLEHGIMANLYIQFVLSIRMSRICFICMKEYLLDSNL